MKNIFFVFSENSFCSLNLMFLCSKQKKLATKHVLMFYLFSLFLKIENIYFPPHSVLVGILALFLGVFAPPLYLA